MSNNILPIEKIALMTVCQKTGLPKINTTRTGHTVTGRITRIKGGTEKTSDNLTNAYGGGKVTVILSESSKKALLEDLAAYREEYGYIPKFLGLAVEAVVQNPEYDSFYGYNMTVTGTYLPGTLHKGATPGKLNEEFQNVFSSDAAAKSEEYLRANDLAMDSIQSVVAETTPITKGRKPAKSR